MSAFLIAAVLLLLSVIAWLLRPLLAPRRLNSGTESPALRVLREQRRELEADLAAARISAQEHAESVAELELRTAAEMAALPAPGEARAARGWAVALALGLPAAVIGIYLIIGQPAGLDPANTAAPQAFGPGEIEAMVDKLAAKVKANPDDLEGVQMLARSYMVLQRFADAARVYGELAQRRPQEAQAYADWADALASVPGQSLAGEPTQLINKALQLDPDNVKALALAGTLAFEQQDYAQAVQHWQRMASKADPQSEIGRNAEAMLAEARARLAAPASPPQGETRAPAEALGITGRVTLDPALSERIAPADVLYVFARPEAGGPPVAALRLRAADLPMEFDFAQAALMGKADRESLFTVTARVSKSGQPAARSGDLEGRSQPLGANTKGIEVRIDKIVP